MLQPGFFAREDTKTPTVFAGISVLINIVLSLALFPVFKHVGIAMATSVAAWANAVLLGVWLGRRGHFRLPAEDWRRLGLIMACSIGMALVLWALAIPLAPFMLASAPLLLQVVVLGGLVILGLSLYFAAVHFSGAQPLGLLLRRLRRNG